MNRDDAISRKDAIKALQNVVCISASIKSRMVGAIEELPSVTHKSGKCKTCKYWQDNNNGYLSDMCKWRTDETPDADDYCSEYEPQESEEISERNMKMWEEIFKAERGDKE